MNKIRGQIVYPLKERLIRLSKLNETTGCIEWQSSKWNGYGKLLIGSRTDGTRKTVTAHRISYEIHYGEIPKGLFICHKCDNRSCINIEHLFLGTRQDNIDDRERKGRNKPRQFGKHENHPHAKLTWKEVNRIREFKNKLTQQEISKIFNISRRYVGDILNFKTWIPEPAKDDEK